MTIVRTQGFECFSDRYKYDFNICAARKGWAQIDSKQDAPYYGQWCNPITRELFSYCEGDLYHTLCDTDDEFTQVLRECIEWNKEREYFIGVDPMGRQDIKDALIRMGFTADMY